jgi:hypothetical protein
MESGTAFWVTYEGHNNISDYGSIQMNEAQVPDNSEQAFGMEDNVIDEIDQSSGGENNFLGNYNDYVLNTGGTVYGAAEIGLSKSGAIANAASRTFGVNAGRVASTLQRVGGTVSTVGAKIGTLGYGISAWTYTSSAFDPNQKLTIGSHVNFGISTVLYGAAFFTAGTVAAPFVGGAALIYGASQLGVQLYSGKTIEQHLFDP